MGGSVTSVRLLFASLALYSQVMERDSLADLLTSVRLVAAGVASLRHGHFSLLPITLSPCISCWMFSSRTQNNVITSIWLFACLLVSLADLVSHVDSIESSCETHVRTPQTVPWPIIALKARADILTSLLPIPEYLPKRKSSALSPITWHVISLLFFLTITFAYVPVIRRKIRFVSLCARERIFP